VRPALPRRAGRRTNIALLALLLVAFVTGVLAYGVGIQTAATVVVESAGRTQAAILAHGDGLLDD
jgi:hypothetical protein